MPVYGTTYYVDATNGNDSNNGTSQATAWKTISKVNSSGFIPGDNILFKRGEIWIEQLIIPSSGNSTDSITFGAYGSGDKPLIRGIYASSKSYITIEHIKVKDYPDAEGGITIIDNSNYVTIDNCVIENNSRNGIAFWCPNYGNGIVISNNIIQNNGSHDSWNSGIFVKGTSGSISGNTIYHNGYGDSQFGYSHGIYIDQGATDIEIYENIVHGNNKGHGIQIKSNADVYRNLVYDNHHAGVYFGENSNDDIIGNIYSNILYGNMQGILEMMKDGGDIRLNIYNNSLYHNGDGSGWSAGILIEDSITSFIARNNIIYPTNDGDTYDIVSQSNAEIDYNCVYRSNPGNFISYGGSSRSLSYWQNTLGFDVHGINDDPEYNDPGNRDFTLQKTSPCIDTGTDVGLTQDFEGNSVPQGSAPDIGAYEYLATGVDEQSRGRQLMFRLYQNYPNPFNPTTRITYYLPSSSYVTLTIYDLLGRAIQTLVSEFQTSGSHSVNFDCGNISSGIYFYQLKAGNKFVKTSKMILMR
jgi:hypothetical protein